MDQKTKNLTVPILPHTSPEAQQPDGMRLPLMPHQLRALNRCLVVERDGGLGVLGKDFNTFHDFRSRGGVLADEVGTGKTATAIGLVLAGEEGNGGDTLVVAPTHLISQWKFEIEKFTTPDAMEVIVGKEEYERKCSVRPQPISKRRIVLIDVDTILGGEKLWYDFRKVYRQGKLLRVDHNTMELYKKAALFSVKSARGPCGYEGWVHVGSLHLPQRPWRRVIFDEIQDLVSEGSNSQKNLLQLTRTASHVWLLSATPFPHGNKSVYANHELLGFCRLRLDVEGPYANPTFEAIKKKLYIRSPRHVADDAVKATQTVVRNTVYVNQLELERRFMGLEMEKVHFVRGSFSPEFNPMREMAVHPEASEELRKVFSTRHHHHQQQQRPLKARSVSSSVSAAGTRAIADAKRRLRQVNAMDLERMNKQISYTRRSLDLAKKIEVLRQDPVRANPFDKGTVNLETQQREKEAKTIHDHYCSCSGGYRSSGCYADRHVNFRVMRGTDDYGPEFLCGSLQVVINYFHNELNAEKQIGNFAALQQYNIATTRSLEAKEKSLKDLEAEKASLKRRIEVLSTTAVKSEGNGRGGAGEKGEVDKLAQTFGSKPAALVRFLQEHADEKVIVFSYWHDTLKLVQRTLVRCGLNVVFCDGGNMSKALSAFTVGDTPIILLSAKSKASGANLQCASRVVLLDPAGQSAEHGSTLESQAIGRAVRMGQEQAVTVTRFCVRDTLEEALFEAIDEATSCAKKLASDCTYVIQGAHKALPERKNNKSNNVKSSDEIKVTGAISAEDRIHLDMLKAEEKGEVIVLLDDTDDEENAPSAPKPISTAPSTTTAAAAASPSPSMRQVNVKTEGPPASIKRADPSFPNVKIEEDRALKRLRTCTQTPAAPKVTGAQMNGQTPRASTVTPATSTISDDLGNDDGQEEVGGSRQQAVKGRMVKVRQLLQSLDLVEYENVFNSKGYDSVGWLYSMSGDAQIMEKVCADVGFTTGHAIRFQMGLTQEAKKD